MIEEIKIKSGKYNIHADLYLPIGGQSKMKTSCKFLK